MVGPVGTPPLPPVNQHLWVVPYAGRNPPILVGRALCRAEPSEYGATSPLKPPGMGGVAPLVSGSSEARALTREVCGYGYPLSYGKF